MFQNPRSFGTLGIRDSFRFPDFFPNFGGFGIRF